jgi:putative two-component system response regulator
MYKLHNESNNDLDSHLLDQTIPLLSMLENSGTSVNNHLYRTYHVGKLLLDLASKHPELKKEIETSDIPTMAHAMLYHDIGKNIVSSKTKNSVGKLTKQEMIDMRRHVDYGVTLLNEYNDKEVNPALFDYAEAVIKSHHEKFDGTGYPLRLSANNIPIVARVMCVVDVFDALLEQREYNPATPISSAINYMRNQAGVSFDPFIIEIMIANIDIIMNIIEKNPFLSGGSAQ